MFGPKEHYAWSQKDGMYPGLVKADVELVKEDEAEVGQGV
jgi:hypothetical protein